MNRNVVIILLITLCCSSCGVANRLAGLAERTLQTVTRTVQ